MLQLIRLTFFFFFFNDPATTEIYTLSLHDALPILSRTARRQHATQRWTQSDHDADRRNHHQHRERTSRTDVDDDSDRKSTRLNSSHLGISYAVFCLKKKKKCTRNDLYMNDHNEGPE